MDNRPICLILAGPTASGKTSISLKLASDLNCEIICMDSMQIYKGMDIGTAKPTEAEKAQAVHHMVDIVEPDHSFSVVQYCEMAQRIACEILSRGRIPLFVGGTGFYLRALRHPMSMGVVKSDDTVRAALQEIADKENGKQILHNELARIDPVTAERLPVGDVRRVIRAIQVYRLTGVPFSQQPQQEDRQSPFRYIAAALTMDRQVLYGRVNDRVDQMISEGLLQEIRRLLDDGIPSDCQAMKAIGYKQFVPYVLGQDDDLTAAIDAVKQGTRHYAKRQLTWLRREQDIYWQDVMQTDAYEQLLTYYKTSMEGISQ